MSFSLRQLRYFVAVAESGQISAAARELYITQSAATTAVRELERSLRQQLLHRTSRGVSLTSAGTAFLPRARAILDLVDEAGAVTIPEESLTGQLRVGVTFTVMGYFLPPHVQRLRARFPQLQIEWLELDRTTVESKILSGDLDMGLLLTSNVTNPALSRQTFVHSPRRLWVAANNDLAGRDNLDLATVAEQPYVMLTVDEADKTTLSYWGTLRPRVILQTTALEAVRSLVANGTGVTILSDMVYRPWSLEGKRIVTVDLDGDIPSLRVGLAWAASTDPSPAMLALREYFHQQFVGVARAQ